MTTLGKKIRELRIAKGLTQSDLGSGMVTPSMISQIESDKANPSYKVLEAISQKLDAPIEYFLSDTQTQQEQNTTNKVAKALISSGNFERAANLLETIQEHLNPNLNLMEVKSDLAECYLNIARHEEAVDIFKQVVELAREKNVPHRMVYALYKIGVVEQNRNKNHQAIYYWKKAFEHFSFLDQTEPFLQCYYRPILSGI